MFGGFNTLLLSSNQSHPKVNFLFLQQVESDNTGIELVELVSYCANKCRTAGTIFCSTVAGHLNHIGGHFPQVSCAHTLLFTALCASLTII